VGEIRKTYSDEFKQKAVNMHLKQGMASKPSEKRSMPGKSDEWDVIWQLLFYKVISNYD
jgi:transposase-like protein